MKDVEMVTRGRDNSTEKSGCRRQERERVTTVHGGGGEVMKIPEHFYMLVRQGQVEEVLSKCFLN